MTPSQLARLAALEKLMGPVGVINIALLLCGARAAYIHGESPMADSMSSMEMVREHTKGVVKAVMTAFRSIKVIGREDFEPMFYRPDLVDKADAKIASDLTKKGDGFVRARGRLLGYAGTAVPCFQYPDVVHIFIVCVDSKGYAHIVTNYCAHPAEVHACIQAFDAFCKKARKLKGARLSPSLTIHSFSMRIGEDWRIGVKIEDEPVVVIRRTRPRQ